MLANKSPRSLRCRRWRCRLRRWRLPHRRCCEVHGLSSCEGDGSVLPRGCLFLVGDYVAGSGSLSRLPSLPGSGSASFSSSCLALPGLEGSASFSPPGGSPMFILRLKSVLVGAPGRWLLRLHQVLRSSGGGDEAPGLRSARASRLGGLSVSASRPGGTMEGRKMNRAPRDLLVIFPCAGVLVVRGGCTVLLFNMALFG